jgi:sodium-dependent dicarboxylate transporter 2/3/5
MTAPDHDHESGPSAAPRGWRLAVLAAAWPIAAGAAVGLGQAGSLTVASTVMLGILLLAAILWVSEAIGAMATSLLVIALCVALLGVPATLGAPWVLQQSRITGWEQFIAPAGSGVMLLLLGSMALGVAVHRTGLDHHVGERVLRPFMGSARSLAFGLMLASAFMSLWMSNTATAAIMLALARGLAPRFEPAPTVGGGTHPAPASRVRAGLALAVALGANVGGIGSPVGTPPGAIIFTRLEKMNEPVTFLGWMAIGVPIAIVVLAAGWLALTRGLGLPPVAPPRAEAPDGPAHPAPDARARRRAARERRVVALVFFITVGLWLTGGLTGIPVEAAALVPLAVLPAAGILRPRDMGQIDWDVLLLILGGLVLGTGMELSGLAEQVVGAAPLAGVSGTTLVAIAAVTAMVLSAFMSNTATANLLAPIGLGLAASIGVDTRGLDLPTAVGFAIALGAGASMPLAVATPANAMAARDGVRARDFLVVGLAVGLAVVLATVALAAILL